MKAIGEIKTRQSTLATSENHSVQLYKEKWSVLVGKENYELNEQQIAVIKQASEAGHTRLVWFKDFAISIAHISDIKLIIRRERDRVAKTRLVFDEKTLTAKEVSV